MTGKAARAAPHTFAGGFYRHCCHESHSCFDTPDREREEHQYALGLNPDHLCVAHGKRRDTQRGVSQ